MKFKKKVMLSDLFARYFSLQKKTFGGLKKERMQIQDDRYVYGF